MSTVAVIVLAVVALLLSAMLLAGARKAARTRPQPDPGPTDDGYRSHAEASRRGDAERL